MLCQYKNKKIKRKKRKKGKIRIKLQSDDYIKGGKIPKLNLTADDKLARRKKIGK